METGLEQTLEIRFTSLDYSLEIHAKVTSEQEIEKLIKILEVGKTLFKTRSEK